LGRSYEEELSKIEDLIARLQTDLHQETIGYSREKLDREEHADGSSAPRCHRGLHGLVNVEADTVERPPPTRTSPPAAAIPSPTAIPSLAIATTSAPCWCDAAVVKDHL